MRRRDKLKQTGVLKTNGSLMNKIFKVYMLLMFVSCVVLMVVFGIRFSSVYNSQARSHMNDVTVAAETGLEERISQIDQLSVSILINNSVQKNLKEINYQTLVNPENTSFQTEKAAISSEIRGSVFNVPGIVSARIFSLDNVEIVIGTSGKRIKADDITKEKIYDQNGGTLWADDEENGMIGLYRAILSAVSYTHLENAPYREACIMGKEFSEIGSHLVNLKKKNDVAILVSNEALTALKWFGIEATAAGNNGIGYNDVVRWIYDALYQMNIECDFVWPESDNLEQYKAIFVPALYAAPDELLERLKQYVADGGTLVATFKTAFANENIKVSHEMQPHILSNCFGINYQQFTFPKNVGLTGSIIRESGADEADKKNETKENIETEENTDVPATAKVFMELLMPQEAEVLASYDHYNWKEYAAITKNHYEKGTAIYIGCMTDDNTLKAVITEALRSVEVELPEYRWPVIVRKGTCLLYTSRCV